MRFLVWLLFVCVLHTENVALLRNTQSNQSKHELHLTLETAITINNSVILRCMGDESNASWYLWKGDTLLIDDGSVNSEYSHDGIQTNHTMHNMYIEFRSFSQVYLDVYRCARETGATSNSLDVNDIFKREPEIKCKNVSAAIGAKNISLQCTFEFPGITCGSNIFWENGITGETINTTEGFYKVVCEAGVNDSFVTVSLNIKTVTDEVLKAEYVIVYVNRHQTTKCYRVFLNQDYSRNNSDDSELLITIGIIAGFFITVAILVIIMSIKKKVGILKCTGKIDFSPDNSRPFL